MTDLRLGDDGDVVLIGGELELVSGVPDVVQRVRCILDLLKGSWPLDVTLGIPWFDDVLGRPRQKSAIDSILRLALTRTPGVLRVERLDSTLDRITRHYEATIVALIDGGSGQAVEVTAQLVTDDNGGATLAMLMMPQGGY